jgi:DNA-directed RNA polymerase subunit RPC12/RpoP
MKELRCVKCGKLLAKTKYNKIEVKIGLWHISGYNKMLITCPNCGYKHLYKAT